MDRPVALGARARPFALAVFTQGNERLAFELVPAVGEAEVVRHSELLASVHHAPRRTVDQSVALRLVQVLPAVPVALVWAVTPVALARAPGGHGAGPVAWRELASAVRPQVVLATHSPSPDTTGRL